MTCVKDISNLLTNVTQVFWWQLQEHVLKNIDSNFNT